VIVNPQNRERVTFLLTGVDTDGELLQMESRMGRGGFVGAEHIHPRQQSRFLILEGRPSFRVNGRQFTLDPGDSLAVPKGVPHKFWNETDGDIRMIIEFRPALKTQQFFEVFFGLSRDGLTDGECARNRLQRAVLFSEYFHESRPVRVPTWRLVARRMLAPLGRLLGYRAWYPRYASDGDLQDALSLEQAV
jgi:mannose-6-phosphate isomerase-like protein (cupin superfamily)